MGGIGGADLCNHHQREEHTTPRSLPATGPQAKCQLIRGWRVELEFSREQQADLPSFPPNLIPASPVKSWLLWDSGKLTRVLWPILGSWGSWLCFNSPRHCQIYLGVREMVHFVKCLLCKHKNPSSSPHNHLKAGAAGRRLASTDCMETDRQTDL